MQEKPTERMCVHCSKPVNRPRRLFGSGRQASVCLVCIGKRKVESAARRSYRHYRLKRYGAAGGLGI